MKPKHIIYGMYRARPHFLLYELYNS